MASANRTNFSSGMSFANIAKISFMHHNKRRRKGHQEYPSHYSVWTVSFSCFMGRRILCWEIYKVWPGGFYRSVDVDFFRFFIWLIEENTHHPIHYYRDGLGRQSRHNIIKLCRASCYCTNRKSARRDATFANHQMASLRWIESWNFERLNRDLSGSFLLLSGVCHFCFFLRVTLYFTFLLSLLGHQIALSGTKFLKFYVLKYKNWL